MAQLRLKLDENLPGEAVTRFWLNLLTRFDLEIERDRLRHRLTREVQVLKRAR